MEEMGPMSHLTYNSREAPLTQHISGFDPLLPKITLFCGEILMTHFTPSPSLSNFRQVSGEKQAISS